MSKKTSKEIKSTRKAAQECTKPSWPELTPLVPTSDLQLDVILDSQIVVIRKLFTKTLCQRYVSFLPSLALTTTPGTAKKGEALRVNDRFQIHDPAFAETLYQKTALETLIKESHQNWGGRVIGLNPNIRIYRYRPGHFFDQHCKSACWAIFRRN